MRKHLLLYRLTPPGAAKMQITRMGTATRSTWPVWVAEVCLLFLIMGMSHATNARTESFQVGILGIGSEKLVSKGIAAFRDEMIRLGYEEGRNLNIQARWADGDRKRLSELAAELAGKKVDVLIATTTHDVQAAIKVTSTIPIVMVTAADPVATGLVASLARPEGNVTGLSLMTIELSTKRLQILKEVFPDVARVAVLWNPDHPFHPKVVKGLQAAAPELGLQLVFVSAQKTAQLAGAIRGAKRAGAHALCVIEDPVFYINRETITRLAGKERLPAIFAAREYSEAGGLLSYGPSYADMWRRVAGYVDRILKGTKPADLPVEQPTNFEFVINLKTARNLDVIIPESVLLQATEVIN